MKKMLDFLQLYQRAPVWRRPSRRAAAALEDMLLFNAGNLTEPALKTELKYVDSALRKFALSYTQDGDILWASLRNKSEFSETSRMPTGFEHFDEEATSDLVLLEAEYNRIPRPVQQTIGEDFFLDVITDKSSLRACEYPLVAVVKGSAARLGLLEDDKEDVQLHCMLRYALRVEAGYPEDMYHCKLHAADVTGRLMAIMKHTGLAGIAFSQAPTPLSLVALVAGCVHDYGHPHRSNAFLVARVCPSSFALSAWPSPLSSPPPHSLCRLHPCPCVLPLPPSSSSSQHPPPPPPTTTTCVSPALSSRLFQLSAGMLS